MVFMRCKMILSMRNIFTRWTKSMGIHESQSRMHEKYVGTCESLFLKFHYSKLVEIFPKQLKNVTVDEFVQYINTAKRSLIRIEADELTYSLHIMVRYELEKIVDQWEIKSKRSSKKMETTHGWFLNQLSNQAWRFSFPVIFLIGTTPRNWCWSSVTNKVEIVSTSGASLITILVASFTSIFGWTTMTWLVIAEPVSSSS